jgi:DNA topoisomerase-3
MNPQDFQEGGRFQVGRVVQAKNATFEASRTEPPKRYTQSDLIDAMMAASRFAKNDRDRALLREIAGLGTSRTRESIITGLVDRGFLAEVKFNRSRSRVELQPSEAAMTIIESLPEMLTDPATTAKWELAFQMLESGKATPENLRSYFESMLKDIVNQAKGIGRLAVDMNPGKVVAGGHFSKSSEKKSASGRSR